MAKLFLEQLAYMTAVTELLNDSDLPKSNEVGIKVLLMDKETDKIVAKWSDEHDSNDWGIELVDPEPSEGETTV